MSLCHSFFSWHCCCAIRPNQSWKPQNTNQVSDRVTTAATATDLWQQRRRCLDQTLFLLTQTNTQDVMLILKRPFSLWFPLWLKDFFFIKLNQKIHFMLPSCMTFRNISFSCPEYCQHVSQRRVSEGFSQRPGEQGLHQVLCATEASKPDSGEVGQHLQRLHRTAGQRHQGREIIMLQMSSHICASSVYKFCKTECLSCLSAQDMLLFLLHALCCNKTMPWFVWNLYVIKEV